MELHAAQEELAQMQNMPNVMNVLFAYFFCQSNSQVAMELHAAQEELARVRVDTTRSLADRQAAEEEVQVLSKRVRLFGARLFLCLLHLTTFLWVFAPRGPLQTGRLQRRRKCSPNG
mgnify:CR=1 FL=1